MLILTRRVGENINIGNEITVQTLGIKGNQVRLGISAPKAIAVHREEIYNKIQAEQEKETPLEKHNRKVKEEIFGDN